MLKKGLGMPAPTSVDSRISTSAAPSASRSATDSTISPAFEAITAPVAALRTNVVHAPADASHSE